MKLYIQLLIVGAILTGIPLLFWRIEIAKLLYYAVDTLISIFSLSAILNMLAGVSLGLGIICLGFAFISYYFNRKLRRG